MVTVAVVMTAVVATETIVAIEGVEGGIVDSSSSGGDTVALVVAVAAKVRGERILFIYCYFKWISKLDQQSAHIPAADRLTVVVLEQSVMTSMLETKG